MPIYLYTARTKEGKIKKGEQTAEDEKNLASLLREEGLLLTYSIEKGSRKGFDFGKIGGFLGSVSLKDKMLFTRHLQIMVNAGISVTRALEILAKQTNNKKFKEIIINIQNEVEAGKSLSDSFSKYPKVFSIMYVSMVKVGEVSGRLDDVLDQLATQMDKDHEIISKVQSGMMYPAVVLIAMIVTVVLMIVFVLPKLVEIFRDMNVQLPWTTKALIALSDFVTKQGIFVFIGFIIFIILFVIFIKSKLGKKIFHKIFLIFPVISTISKKMNLARFSRALSSLIKSGVPIVKALDIISDSLGNIYYKKVVKESSVQVKKGKSITDIYSQYPKLFPAVVTQMMAVGEETGKLDDILVRLSTFYEFEIDNFMKNISSIIEPILMIILGVGVGVIAISIISPIYSLVGSL